MLAWCAFSSVCRSAGKSRPSPTRSWVKKVWRKVRKSKGQWLQLTVYFDLCDSTHWSLVPHYPKQHSFHPHLNPEPPTGTYGSRSSILRCPWLSCITEPWKQDNIPHGQVCSMTFLALFFYLRYPKKGAEPEDLICPYCLISCYLTVVGHDR